MSKDYLPTYKIKIESFKDLLADEGLHEETLFKLYDILDEISEHETMFTPNNGHLVWLAKQHSQTYANIDVRAFIDQVLNMPIFFVSEEH